MKPEVIVKLHFLLDCTGDDPVPIPQVRLFANQAGYHELSRDFARLSRLKDDPKNHGWDPTNHQQLIAHGKHTFFNPTLGDDIEFYCGILTKRNRKRVTKKYGLSRKSPFKNDGLAHFQWLLVEATRAVNEMKELRKSRRKRRV